MPSSPVVPDNLSDLVQDHLDGVLEPENLAQLEAVRPAWIEMLYRKLDDAEWAIDRANKRLRGSERTLVVADFDAEAKRIDEVLTELVGPAPTPVGADSNDSQSATGGSKETRTYGGVAQLQLSWLPGRIVAFAAGQRTGPSG